MPSRSKKSDCGCRECKRRREPSPERVRVHRECECDKCRKEIHGHRDEFFGNGGGCGHGGGCRCGQEQDAAMRASEYDVHFKYEVHKAASVGSQRVHGEGGGGCGCGAAFGSWGWGQPLGGIANCCGPQLLGNWVRENGYGMVAGNYVGPNGYYDQNLQFVSGGGYGMAGAGGCAGNAGKYKAAVASGPQGGMYGVARGPNGGVAYGPQGRVAYNSRGW